MSAPHSWSVHCNFTGDGKCNERGWACTPPPSPAWANFTLMIECTPESCRCYSVEKSEQSPVYQNRSSLLLSPFFPKCVLHNPHLLLTLLVREPIIWCSISVCLYLSISVWWCPGMNMADPVIRKPAHIGPEGGGSEVNSPVRRGEGGGGGYACSGVDDYGLLA